MPDHVENRMRIVDALRRELVGPDPAGAEVNVDGELEFTDFFKAYGPWRQGGSGEEILARDRPTKRYGVGVLFPVGVPLEDMPTREDDDADDAAPPSPSETPRREGTDGPPEIDVRGTTERVGEAEDDFDLSLANAYHPSSLGLSFLVRLPAGSKLVVEATGGGYHRKTVTVRPEDRQPRSRRWWLRVPVRLKAEFPAEALLRGESHRCRARAGDEGFESQNTDGLDLVVEVLSRPRGEEQSLLTVCLVNRTRVPNDRALDEGCLFQASLRASISSPDGGAHVLPYPDLRAAGDEEEESLALLYRDVQTFATGHGCSASWVAADASENAREVSADCLPVAETPRITPDITRDDGTPVLVSMAALAGLVDGQDGRAQLTEVVELYERWIGSQRTRATGLRQAYTAAAHRHLRECEDAARRMREGLAYLDESETARRAFRLANQAMLLQQIAAARSTPRRILRYRPDEDGLVFDAPFQAPDPRSVPEGRGQWWPFQVAFLLATIRSAGQGDAPDRLTVELIWFPTGGGKTEAYLGLAAFAMFKRRLDNPNDLGVHTIMRYTLRLLTAQQFQRASALICAMEHLRKQDQGALGQVPFSIGIWLGGETTPNTREQARRALSELVRDPDADNPFLLTRCPWCSAQFGRVPIESRRRAARRTQGVYLGYARRDNRVTLQCPDPACEFHEQLPVLVVDEDIYEERPTLVIGTIDKFAMLAWRPEARALFGLTPDGSRVCSPPGLIIQDELHLISGPLGSLAGLYESVIEELCTDRRGVEPVRPKIVSSTATIRRYVEQIRSLYARERVALFPPPGLDAGDSFFARYDKRLPGRMYVGVHAPSLGSVQTEWVRTFAALLQAPLAVEDSGRDPWWTLLVFFNSIREMGTAHTLFQSDVPDYLRVIWNRQGTPVEAWRSLTASRVFELTGGLQSGEVADAISKLEVPHRDTRGAVDICMASSIIEVGIDIQRLSLLVVAGQPKTTSQYIQVTGRVGRHSERPGLVVTMYSPSKPRDRSHFERFRSYHERLYANVEPTSVTPFSAAALDRALHAVVVAYCRQSDGRSVAERPWPYPQALVDAIGSILRDRSDIVDPHERESLTRMLDQRAREWLRWQRPRWVRDGSQDIPLLRVAGDYATEEEKALSWATPTSMRNVDAECAAEITTLYLRREEAEGA